MRIFEDMNTFGHFDDAAREYVIINPIPRGRESIRWSRIVSVLENLHRFLKITESILFQNRVTLSRY